MNIEQEQPKREHRGGYRRARRHIEAVADQLDACLRDQSLSGQGWAGLATLWRSAEKTMSLAEDWLIWSEGTDEVPDLRPHLASVAANLLDLAAMVEAMRRAER